MTTQTKKPAHRVLNDLAEQNFKTPENLTFIRYGRRKDADYKISKHPDTQMHFIEVVRNGEYTSAWKDGWEKADNFLIYLCQKFGKPAAVKK